MNTAQALLFSISVAAVFLLYAVTADRWRTEALELRNENQELRRDVERLRLKNTNRHWTINT